MSRATRGGDLFTSDGSRLNEADNIKNSTDFTGARITMGEIHAYIHRGIVFDLSPKITIESGQKIYLTGESNGKIIHFHREEYNANAGGIEIKFYENVIATGGTLLQGKNRNRIKNNESTFELRSGATVTDTGTELYLIGFPTSTTPVAGGTQNGSETMEWVLKRETKYAIEIHNTSNAQRVVYGSFTWYEVDPPL